MSAPVHFSCASCSRKGKKAAHVLAYEVENNRARCDYCGGELRFPPEFRAQLEAANSFGGLDLGSKVTYSCPKCVRPVESTLEGVLRLIARKRTRCQICANSLSFPPEVLEAIAREQAAANAAPGAIRFPCPICTKAISARSPQHVTACTYCGAAPLPPPAPGQPWRPPPSAIPPAGLDEVRAIARELKESQDPLCQLVYWSLRARAKLGQVSAAETVVAKAKVLRWAAWRRGSADPNYLPLDLDEAEQLLPTLMFPGMAYQSERGSGGLDLVFANTEGLASRSVGKLLFEALDAGISTVAAVGGAIEGLSMVEAGGVGRQTLRIRVRLQERGEGVELSLHSQYGADAPKRMAAKTEEQFLRERVFSRTRQLACWFGLGALFGGWVELPQLTRVQPEAAALRLRQLGWPEGKLSGAAALICGP